MKNIKFNQIEFPVYITGDGNGFMSQWCCGCGLRHIWHFKIHEGDKSTKGNFIEINMMADDTGTKLRKFYKKQIIEKVGEDYKHAIKKLGKD